MASPQSTTSHEDEKKNLEQITFRFCAECSNMLYPKEDPDAHKLQFTCRTCQYTEEASSSCVFRNVLNNAAGETAGVTQDVGSDPTVGAASASHSTPGNAVLCLCCGGLVACRSCGLQIYLPQSAASSVGSCDSSDETRSCSTDTTDVTDVADTDNNFNGVFCSDITDALYEQYESGEEFGEGADFYMV